MNRIITHLFVCTLTLGAGRLAADVVETKSGAKITGTVSRIADGHVHVVTDYAGTVTIRQDAVTAIHTDAPLAVRLDSGTRLSGKLSPAGEGRVQIVGADGAITTAMQRIAASWDTQESDPQIIAGRRHWTYEAAADLTGKTGNKEQLGTAASFRAILEGGEDTLEFMAAYDRQVADGVKSADQFKAGVDYESRFAGRLSWYAREEGGFDRVKDIEFFNVAAAGMGHDLIRAPGHKLTGRLGLSFRYEGYRNPATVDVKAVGADAGLKHSFRFGFARLVNTVSWVPSFDDFANYRLTHEGYCELPMAHPAWKLRLGVANDYNSQPGPGIKRLDTTWFTRLALNWR